MDDASVLGFVRGQFKKEAKGNGSCKNLGQIQKRNV
jgi:hypothetical protein